MTTVIAKLSALIAQHHNLQASAVAHDSARWDNHDAIQDIQDNWLPSGAGIDAGVQVDLDKSTTDRIVLTVSYHHMNEHGYYDGWADYKVTLSPSFDGRPNIRVSGRDRNGIKDYIADVILEAVQKEWCAS